MAKAPKQVEESPNFTPLLDLVLNLIMFFMITANYVQSERLSQEVALPITQSSLPTQSGGDEKIFLTLSKDGKLLGFWAKANRKGDTEWKELQRLLANERAKIRRRYADGDPNIVIILRADKDARYSEVYGLLDACAQKNFESWQLRVKQRQ